MINRFSPQDLSEAQELLAELYDEVSSEESVLSGGKKLDVGSEALQGLRETKVTFGTPTNNLIRLTKKLFDDIGIELSEIHRRQMRDQFNFFYMTLAVSMQPKRGALFHRVECALDFGPKGSREPIIQSIFPKSEWKEVLSWGGGMHLALKGDLEWAVGVSPLSEARIADLPGQMQASVANKDNLKAFIAMPDYAFKLGRAEIAAAGEGNSECFWRIEKPDLQEAQTVEFGVVFKVPKQTARIKLFGLVAAEPDINWLVANLNNVLEDLSGKLQRFLGMRDGDRSGKNRLPIGDSEEWTIRLPE